MKKRNVQFREALRHEMENAKGVVALMQYIP